MVQRDPPGEVHRADPAYRRQMQVVLAATVVLGVAALVALQWWLSRLGSRVQAGELLTYNAWLQRLLAGVCAVFAVAAGAFAQWLFRTARETALERRWPPSAMRTSSDMRVRYLTSADALVAQLRGGAFALALLGVVLAAWAIWLFRAAG